MARMGTVESLFRYPVKSMQGESVDRIAVTELGFAGDRGWAVRDERRGDFFTAKRIGALMGCRALASEAGEAPEIELPDGTRVSDLPAGTTGRDARCKYRQGSARAQNQQRPVR